ncbi:sialidase family protein [Planctomycetota bacterium]
MKKFIAILLMSLVCNLYADGLSFSPGTEFMRTAKIESVEGLVYVYGTIEMGPVNPVKYIDGKPQWRPESDKPTDTKSKDIEAGGENAYEMGPEAYMKKLKSSGQPLSGGKAQGLAIITLGQQLDGKFTPIIRFGLADDNRAKKDSGMAHITPWVSDGRIDYYGMYARPNTPIDFKLRLDLQAGTLSAFVSCRGEDQWFILAENVKLTNSVTKVNKVQIEQYPDSPAIKDLLVLPAPWPVAESVRPHPLRKKDRVVGPGRGFKFQPMRSAWHEQGKHVTITREPGAHCGWPDVVQVDSQHLVCVWGDFAHTGGSQSQSLAHSYDLGKTWDKPVRLREIGLKGATPRLQKLKDGRLLLTSDVRIRPGYPIVLIDSIDGGHTWINERWVQPIEEPEHCGPVPSRILEVSDGSWLMASCWFTSCTKFHRDKSPDDVKGPERARFYRSTDQGKTWVYWSETLAYPPYNSSEPTILELPDGRLLAYTRESRSDNMPATKFYSNDKGRTWDVHELPYPITGRTCAGFLKDGRVMITFRSGIGPSALRAWIGYADDMTGFQPSGGHFNDHYSVGLKDGALHIDNDGMCGQFTLYNFRPMDSSKGTIEVTTEVKVLRNDGYAAMFSVPYAGKFRVFPDHIEMAHDNSLRVDVTEGEFHTYRVISRVGNMKLYVDGELRLDTDKGDDRAKETFAATVSYYETGFGNEARGSSTDDTDLNQSKPNVFNRHITQGVTGYSIWRRFEQKLDDPVTGKREISWVAKRDGLPDQYQLDHIVEVEATISGSDQGYSGWIQLEDGRILVVNYTDDTSHASVANHHNMGIPYIRGTFLELSDLPPLKK